MSHKFRFAAELSITGGEGDSILNVRCIITSKVGPGKFKYALTLIK